MVDMWEKRDYLPWRKTKDPYKILVSEMMLQQARIIVKKTIEDEAKKQNPINFDMIKNDVTDAISRFLFEKTNKRPIVIPVVLGV